MAGDGGSDRGLIEELHGLYCRLNVIRVMKSRTDGRGMWHVLGCYGNLKEGVGVGEHKNDFEERMVWCVLESRGSG